MVAYEYSCQHKIRYGSRKSARIARKRTPSIGHLSIYRCIYCEFFHLGHLTDAVRRGELDRQEWRMQ